MKEREDALLSEAVPLLLEWYRLCRRELPWRENTEFYRVWISEIMLQQTRVEAVKGYFLRFVERFPSVEALAAADEEEVLKAWEGLGYYSRARNLHRAAKQMAKEGIPQDYAGVRALPGVGDYTAGAICSIACHLPCPAVDGNVLRVLTRLFASPVKIDGAKARKEFEARLKEVYPPEAGEFCQALMELGALVCLPNGAPLCGQCPWRALCRAHAAGEETKSPVRGEKKERRIETQFVYVLRCGERYALVKREGTGLLAGLWQFPCYQTEQVFAPVLATMRAKHVFTHVEWHMTGILAEVPRETPSFMWATKEEIKTKYALPSAFRPFAVWLE